MASGSDVDVAESESALEGFADEVVFEDLRAADAPGRGGELFDVELVEGVLGLEVGLEAGEECAEAGVGFAGEEEGLGGEAVVEGVEGADAFAGGGFGAVGFGAVGAGGEEPAEVF